MQELISPKPSDFDNRIKIKTNLSGNILRSSLWGIRIRRTDANWSAWSFRCSRISGSDPRKTPIPIGRGLKQKKNSNDFSELKKVFN